MLTDYETLVEALLDDGKWVKYRFMKVYVIKQPT